MTDIKEIIRVLGFIQEYFDNHADEQEPDCRKEMFRDWSEITLDAITLLKAQEPVEPKIVDTSNSKLYHNDMFKNHYCGNCGEFLHVVNRKDMFCSQCGRAVKWE